MKKLLFVLLVALLGGLVALGGAKYFGFGEAVKYVEVETTPANYANFATPSNRPAPVPSEGFVTAADKALPAVVHIKASKDAYAAMRRGNQPEMPELEGLPDAFRDLFRGTPRGGGDGDSEAPRRLQQGSGSGVIISADGYIATNNHVVENAEDLEVVLNDQRTYPARVIGTDPTTDIALIKIEEGGLPTIDFADSDKVRVGEWVVAVGNPFSLTNTVTAGIVSAKGRSIDIIGQRGQNRYAIESFIQTDAVVNPGNSGGALVNADGDLVGINTAISSPTGVFAGYSFAVPSQIVKKVVQDLREYGVVQRGLLGAEIRQINKAFADQENLNRETGVYISNVIENSAAEAAELQKGDIILGVNGTRTLRNSELLEQLGRRRPGDEVTLRIERAGRKRDITVQLRNRDGNFDPVERSAEPTLASVSELGVDVENLDELSQNRFDVNGGVKITELNPGLVSDQTRIRPGFIVTKVDGREVRNASDFADMTAQLNGTVTLEGFYPQDPTATKRYALVVE